MRTKKFLLSVKTKHKANLLNFYYENRNSSTEDEEIYLK